MTSTVLVNSETESMGVGERNGGRHAYATMFYVGTPRDYEFYIATRVMIHSLKRTKTKAEIIVIASRGVPTGWIKQLTADGADVRQKDDLPNPFADNKNYDQRFVHAVNKLLVWSLLEYDRVVMLDADNLFIRNVDELFQCGEFCAVFINPCYFHTGLFVLKPSNETFYDMLYQYPQLHNRDGADQGFLISYYPELLHAPFFRPPPDGRQLHGNYRLPFGYQMDHSFHLVRLNWNLDGKDINPASVITYPSFPILKPWYWWSWPFLPLTLGWHEVRRTGIGYEAENQVAAMEAALLLLLLLLGFVWHVRQAQPPAGEKAAQGKCCVSRSSCSATCRSRCSTLSFIPSLLWTCLIKALILAAIVASFILPFLAVPSTVHPFVGWSLVLLGSLTLLLGLSRIRPLSLPLLPLLVPWALVTPTIFVLGNPFYSNGLHRPVAVGVWAVLGSPVLFWAVSRLCASVDSACSWNHSGDAFTREEEEPFVAKSSCETGDRKTACVPRSKKSSHL